MDKDKFQKGDLVWLNLRGYGVVSAFGQGRRTALDIVGICDYADIRWQSNFHGNQSKIFRGSMAWDETVIKARINQTQTSSREIFQGEEQKNDRYNEQ